MFDTSYLNFIEKNMDVSALKRKVTADNIANYNTPDFKATRVKFEQALEGGAGGEIAKAEEGHMDGLFGSDSEPQLTQDASISRRTDGNNVDLNTEMMDMIKNNYMFSQSVSAINKEFYLNKLAMGK